MSRHFARSAAAMVALALVSMAPQAWARDFNERTIRGTFTLFVEGRVAPGNLFGLIEGTPLFAVATVRFDGFGRCESRDRIVIRGQDVPDSDDPLALREASACVYSVEPDGFGTFAVTFDEPRLDDLAQSGTTTTTTFIITNPDEIQFIANNQDLGIYGGGVLKRQSLR